MTQLGVFAALLVVLGTSFPLAHSNLSFVAHVSMLGIDGNVYFRQSENGEDINVTLELNGEGADSFASGSITSIPPIFGQGASSEEVCANLRDEITGFKLRNEESVDYSEEEAEAETEADADLIGSLTDATTEPQLSSGSIPNMQTNMLFTRGVVLYSSDSRFDRVCATIFPLDESETVVTYRATFLGPIVGQVWIRALTSTQGLFVYSELSNIDATNARDLEGTEQHQLLTYRDGELRPDFKSRCNGLTAEKEVMQVPVGNSAHTNILNYRHAGITTDLCNAALGKFLAIGTGSQLSCAELDVVSTKTVIATINWNNVFGSIVLSQNSPFEHTAIAVTLASQQLPVSYSINKFPVPQRLPELIENPCDVTNVGGLFGSIPYEEELGQASINSDGFTSDQYLIGDLSSKYGLINSTNFEQQFFDWNLPLFGVNSVAGRSIVFYSGEDRNAIACGNLEYNGEVLTAVATFKSPIYGSMYFRQASTGDDTYIFGELADLNGRFSSDHHFDVRNYSVGDNCYDTGLLYDPANVDRSTGIRIIIEEEEFIEEDREIEIIDPLTGERIDEQDTDIKIIQFEESERVESRLRQNALLLSESRPAEELLGVLETKVEDIDREEIEIHEEGVSVTAASLSPCSVDTPQFCAVGDISRKVGTIDISEALHESNKFFFTTSYLPLFGDLSILKRSLMVYGAEMRRDVSYACANITRVHTTVLQNTNELWNGDNTGGDVNGYFTILQDTQYDVARVSAEVTGLNNELGSFSINEKPSSDNLNIIGQCSEDEIGNIFNPFDASRPNNARQLSFDQLPVGNLSGKYFSSIEDISDRLWIIDIQDNNLPVTTGLISVAGRSILLNRDRDDDVRWKCTTLDLVPHSDYEAGYAVDAEAILSTPYMTATVKLRQVVYESDFSTVTTILVNFENNVIAPVFDDNWQIHKDPILNQTQCGAARGLYDPYDALMTSEDYVNRCNKYNPLACAVGDLSRKQSIATPQMKMLYVDEDVPLHTKNTVIGRSLVFHAENGGADASICANIVPTGTTFTVAFDSSVEYDYYRFTDAVATSLRIERFRVIVVHNVEVPLVNGECAKVIVTIAGPVLEILIDELIDGRLRAMSPYVSLMPDCKSSNDYNDLGMPGGKSKITSNVFLVVFSSLMMVLSLHVS